MFFPNGVGASGGITQNLASQQRNTFYRAGQDTLLVDLGAQATNSSVAFSLGSIPGVVDLDARLARRQLRTHGAQRADLRGELVLQLLAASGSARRHLAGRQRRRVDAFGRQRGHVFLALHEQPRLHLSKKRVHATPRAPGGRPRPQAARQRPRAGRRAQGTPCAARACRRDGCAAPPQLTLPALLPAHCRHHNPK
jgi:hypothetical protein